MRSMSEKEGKRVRAIAIDPGGTTGFCTAIEAPKNVPMSFLLKAFQLPDDCEDLWNRLADLKPDVIVCESFEYRQRSRAGLDLTPVKLIGIVELYEAKSGCKLYMQTAAKGKGYYTDVLLKKYDFYKRGLPHGMDALRHMLQWFTFGAGYQYLGSNKIENFVAVL